MLAAAPDAGVFYVCTPNNPTGTLTSHSDIEYLVENKPKGSVVLVDEAYIHFSDAVSVMDLVKAGKDVILLRTFSKIYGMAGLRCGAVFGRPDLLEKIENYCGVEFLSDTPPPAASAARSLPGSTATDTPTSLQNRTASCSTRNGPRRQRSMPWQNKMYLSGASGRHGQPTRASRLEPRPRWSSSRPR